MLQPCLPVCYLLQSADKLAKALDASACLMSMFVNSYVKLCNYEVLSKIFFYSYPHLYAILLVTCLMLRRCCWCQILIVRWLGIVFWGVAKLYQPLHLMTE